MMSTMSAPITALATEPRPPPSELPPSTAAVSAVNLEADAGVGAGAAERAANRKPASALRTDDQI